MATIFLFMVLDHYRLSVLLDTLFYMRNESLVIMPR